jgi:hypothetical protein
LRAQEKALALARVEIREKCGEVVGERVEKCLHAFSLRHLPHQVQEPCACCH